MTRTCSRGFLCWLEGHAGAAAWLQGVGTLVALLAVAGAYLRYRREGFRPRMRARCNPDGSKAILLVSNLGRTSGEVSGLLVTKGRKLKGNVPTMYPSKVGACPPCSMGAGETMRLLLYADEGPRFTDSSVRIAILFGAGSVKKTSVRPLSKGTIDQDYFATSDDRVSEASKPSEASDDPVPSASWEAVRQELIVLAQLHKNGELSRLDLLIGRYRCLRRAQHGGRSPNEKDDRTE
jgi:hypothetical protein